jgi:septation ring formation regulator EzrA
MSYALITQLTNLASNIYDLSEDAEGEERKKLEDIHGSLTNLILVATKRDFDEEDKAYAYAVSGLSQVNNIITDAETKIENIAETINKVQSVISDAQTLLGIVAKMGI